MSHLSFVSMFRRNSWQPFVEPWGSVEPWLKNSDVTETGEKTYKQTIQLIEIIKHN